MSWYDLGLIPGGGGMKIFLYSSISWGDRFFGIVLAHLTAIQEVPSFIPSYTLEIFLEV